MNFEQEDYNLKKKKKKKTLREKEVNEVMTREDGSRRSHPCDTKRWVKPWEADVTMSVDKPETMMSSVWSQAWHR